jgi:CO/xanthine dehydrogenase FAD-binding subunit
MPDPEVRQVFYPETVNELIKTWNMVEDCSLFRSPAIFLKRPTSAFLTAAQNIIVLTGIEEMTRISRTERFIDIGSMVTLSQIMNMQKIAPKSLCSTIAILVPLTNQSLFTLGGVICDRTQNKFPAIMIGLGASYELRSIDKREKSASYWISAERFTAELQSGSLSDQNILVRVRIPLEIWDINECLILPASLPEERSEGLAVFLARAPKNVITDVRIVFSGGNFRSPGKMGSQMNEDNNFSNGNTVMVHDQLSEALLTGKQLPLHQRDVSAVVDQLHKTLKELRYPSAFTKARFIAFIEKTITNLAE